MHIRGFFFLSRYAVRRSENNQENFLSQLTDKNLIHPETETLKNLQRLPLLERVFIFFGVVAPFAGFLAACVLFWGRGFGWTHLAILIGGYVLTGGSITIGYHRLFTHRGFGNTRPIK